MLTVKEANLKLLFEVGNVENKWATFQDGTGKAAFSPLCRAHVLNVRSARQQRARPTGRSKQYCGLTGRTFLNIPSS